MSGTEVTDAASTEREQIVTALDDAAAGEEILSEPACEAEHSNAISITI
ncbi:MAG: hypothetical protein MEQ74_13550 [Paracoccus sp.]|nr:hypothetical protein [Paracoccus sp. (in: a-proteobacteria)]